MHDLYDEVNNIPAGDTGYWETGNGRVPIRVIAYSLGATRACVIIGTKQLEIGNWSITWLPVSKLVLDCP
jgi:hypothetical protein